MPIYSHPGIFQPRYALSGGTCRYVGIPLSKDYLVQMGAEFQNVDVPLELLPNLWISGSVPRETTYEEVASNLVIPADDCECCNEGTAGFVNDGLPDDMALYLRCSEGLMVLGGCAHSGIINMVNHGLKVTGSIKLHGLMGGTHLGPASEAQQNATLAALQWFSPNLVASNHCTGFWMMTKLAVAFEKKFVPAFCGTSIEC